MSLRERGKDFWLFVAGSLMILIAVLVGVSGQPVQAASSVNIVSQNISCSGASVTYTVGGSVGEDYALIIVWAGDSGIAYTNGPGTPDGTYSASVAIDPPQPDGTALHLTVQVGEASAQGADVNCGAGGGESGAGGGSSGGWSGSADGRLSPDPAEYYSVWCKFNQVEVWRAVPQSVLVESLPLLTLLGLGEGQSTVYNSLTVARNGETITISGSNGNGAPAAGSKAFALSDCVASNGGVPDMATALPRIIEADLPVAAFEVEQAFTSRIVRLLDRSTGTINAWSWDFGDGTASQDRNPSHTYAESGIFTVALTVTGPGGTSSASADVLVAIDPQATESEAPLAAITFRMEPVVVDDVPRFAFFFEDASIGDVDTWSWQIDGGQFSDQQNPPIPYYMTFPQMLLGGPRIMTLTVTGPGGSDTASAAFGELICSGIGFAAIFAPGSMALARLRRKRRSRPGKAHEKD